MKINVLAEHFASVVFVAAAVVAPSACLGAATISLKAVAKNGVAITPTNSLAIAPNDTVTAEVFISSWSTPPFDPPTNSGLVQTFQGMLLGADGATSNGSDGTVHAEMVLPVGWNAPLVRDTCPCDQPSYPSCDPAYGCVGPGHNPPAMANINTTRSDWMFFGFPSFSAIDVSSLNIRWGATINSNDGQISTRCQGGINAGGPCSINAECPGGTCNPLFQSYAGTLNLKVGANICGVSTFTLSAVITHTFISNTDAVPIFVLPVIDPLTLSAAIGCGCASDPECDDANPCTDDVCQAQICQNIHNAAGCSDGNSCTVGDLCTNGTCVPGPSHDCSPIATPCIDVSCDPAGPAGNCDVVTLKPNGFACTNGVFCDGMEKCFDGACVQGVPACREGLGCFETDQICGPCTTDSDCHDGFECTLKTCVSGSCAFDASPCESACCTSGDQCVDGLNPQDCQAAGGVFLEPELACLDDLDNDGVFGCLDQCPRDSLKTSPGSCGCNGSELDSDADAVADCSDCCANTVSGQAVDSDGCVLTGGCRSQSIGSCAEDVSAAYCDSVNGIYLGNGSSCDIPCLPCPRRSRPLPDSQNPPKTRFLSFEIPEGYVCETALRVRLVSLHHVTPPYAHGPSVPFQSLEGEVRWVGPPELYRESTANETSFYAASLQCTPYYRDWSGIGLLHVMGSAVVPSSSYEVENVDASCVGIESDCAEVSVTLTIVTTRWGDVGFPFNPPESSAQPDLGDVATQVSKFRDAPGAPIKAQVLLAGDDALGHISTLHLDFGFTHIAACVDAFRGKAYPYSIEACP